MGPPRDHFCEVWSKSNEQFQSRRCLSKKVDGRRTKNGDGRRTKAGNNKNAQGDLKNNKNKTTKKHKPSFLEHVTGTRHGFYLA